MKLCTPFLLISSLVAASNIGTSGDAITYWNEAALAAIRIDKTPPPRASRALAMLHIALFDAVNGVKQPHEQRFHSYLINSHGHGKGAEEAAASSSGHLVLVHLFPAQKQIFDALYDAALAALPNGKRNEAKAQENGIAWGEFVAKAIIDARVNDGATATVPLPEGTGPGSWVSTPPANAGYLLPQWAFLECFAMTDPAQFRPPGPPELDRPEWAADFNEVKALGRATGSTRTAEQEQIALFWADGVGTETPPGHWNSIAQDVAAARGNTADENARLFALLNIAMADAAICAWDAKYTFNFWRPITAIRHADTDGNVGTAVDATWNSFIPTPPFPDYVSGHGAFSGAAASVLAQFYGSDQVSFKTTSDVLPGVFRTFTSFSEAAEEAAVSRVYGGIHFRFASEDGLNAGVAIGELTVSRYLRPKNQP